MAICSLISPLLFIQCTSGLNLAFGDNQITYNILLIILMLLFLGFDGAVMRLAAKIPEGLEKSGCLLLTTSTIGIFGILFWLGFFAGD